jgi:hypothetical protein
MTEYIIMVGLIAILLSAVVERYKEQIRVTIVGTDGNGGMVGGNGLGGVAGAVPNGGKKTSVAPGTPGAFEEPKGSGKWYKYGNP